MDEANRGAFTSRIVAPTTSVSPQLNATDLSKEAGLLNSELKVIFKYKLKYICIYKSISFKF